MRLLLSLSFLLASIGRTPATALEGIPPDIAREIVDRTVLPAGRFVPLKSWSAVEAQHLTGAPTADAQAKGRRAWESRTGRDTPGRAMLYGPYLEVASGVYLALVRMKVLENTWGEKVCDLDAVTDYGQHVWAFKEVRGNDLSLRQYVYVPLVFHCPGGNLEIRTHWSGYASLRLDMVHLYRVEDVTRLPVPARAAEPRPSGKPNDLKWQATASTVREVFPRSAPPAETVMVFDVRRELPDVQMATFVLQGLVNRGRPRLYCLYNETDIMWLNWLRRNGWVKNTRLVRSFPELYQTCRSSLRGLVITDPSLPASRNVANMLASINDLLVVSPRMRGTMSVFRGPSALPVKADLRGRFKSNAEAYQWALDNLSSRLNMRLAACSHPDHLGLRDYLTQHKAFIFWVSGPLDGAQRGANPTEEVCVAEQILARMPANTPIMSYPWAGKDVGMGEGPGVTLFAEFGKYLVGSINCTNLSVHSGIRVASLRPRNVRPPRLEPSRVYLSFIMSDGDNLPVLTVNNFPQLWQAPERGRVPIGWTVSPAAMLLIPAVLQYYYSTATSQDAFLAAVSGVGYTYPDSYALRYRPEDRDKVFDGFLQQTNRYMQACGLTGLWLMNATSPDIFRRYADKIPLLEALFPDYGRRVASYALATYPTSRNVPVFHAVTGWSENATREQKITRMVDEIRSMTPSERPAFLHVFIWNWGADLSILPEVLKRLGPAYVAVRPDHLAALFRQDFARRGVLVRWPDEILAIEGQVLRVKARVYGYGPNPMRLQAKVADTLASGRVMPVEINLSPGQSTELVVQGTPVSEPLTLLLEGPLGVRRYSTVVRTVRKSEMLDALPEGSALTFVGRFEGEELSHNSGVQIADVDARGGLVWKADAGSGKPGYVVFGPYIPLPEGRYLAVFRVKGGGTTALLGAVDVCVGGGNPILAKRALAPEDLTPEGFRCVALEFSHPGGTVETRLQWNGDGWVALDWVGLWRIENADASE